MIKPSDNFVVIIELNHVSMSFGYRTLPEAVKLITDQFDVNDPAKVIGYVQDAMTDGGLSYEGVTYTLVDVTTFQDLFESEEDSE